MSEAVQEILRPAIDTNPHTTPLARSFVPVLIQIILNTTTLPEMFFEGRSGQDFTVAPARRPPGYFDTHPTLAIFFIHISALLLFWQPSCSFFRPTFVKLGMLSIFFKFEGGVTRVTLVHVSHQMGVGAHLNNLAVVRYCVRQPQKMWQSLSQISNIVYLAQIILLRSLQKGKYNSISNATNVCVCVKCLDQSYIWANLRYRNTFLRFFGPQRTLFWANLLDRATRQHCRLPIRWYSWIGRHVLNVHCTRCA